MVEIYRKFVRYRGLVRRREKGEIECWRRRRLGWYSFESFSDALARTHVTCVLVGRDPPTHSCWRSVVDDNGNPIFRNNICLEDRRLTSCDADVYTCVFVCVCTCTYCTKCSIPTVMSLILSFQPFWCYEAELKRVSIVIGIETLIIMEMIRIEE